MKDTPTPPPDEANDPLLIALRQRLEAYGAPHHLVRGQASGSVCRGGPGGAGRVTCYHY
ncbi:hypothetical protein [Hymenobacter sp. BRD67]|uniref:hypothetical protein n=1 Tax=Hymenobacter sp. BRD67 TaxID=2675877 RepID=UPI0015634136|nr:hypothetical protein [Hymenobacter sp. BRD67]QKG54406.1 hypothetical protein GKZ67_19610 [Hymenobacter sp. BRD67]